MPALIRKVDAARSSGGEVVVWGTGTPRREFLYVDDCADACVFLMQNYSDASHVNVGSGEDITIEKLTRLVMDVLGYDGPVVHDLSKPDGTPRKLMDVSRLNNLGWHAVTSLRDGISLSYKAYQDGHYRESSQVSD